MTKERDLYFRFATVLTNTFLLLVVSNLLLAVLFAIRDYSGELKNEKAHSERLAKRPGQPKLTPKRNGYQMLYVDMRSYEDVDPGQVEEVLDAFFEAEKLGFSFEPYTQLAPREQNSRVLNVVRDSFGFLYRRGEKRTLAETPADVFVFGGSTLFGYNAADEWTLPFYLEKELTKYRRNIQVINYGRNTYSWNQELILFSRLLHAGHRPQVALFVDGVNFYHNGPTNLPRWSNELARLWERKQLSSGDTYWPSFIPMFRFVNHFHRNSREKEFNTRFSTLYPGWGHETYATNALQTVRSYENTIQQIRSIAQAFNVKTQFLWQPHRAYRCQSEKYSQALPQDYEDNVQEVYKLMEGRRLDSFHNLSSLCEELDPVSRVFVDDLHYSPHFNQFLARRIASLISPLVL